MSTEGGNDPRALNFAGYPHVHQLLQGAVGKCGIFTDDEVIEGVHYCIANELWGRRTIAELRLTLADPEWSWRSWLNEVSEFEFATEELARGYASECIWKPIFGREMPPPHGEA